MTINKKLEVQLITNPSITMSEIVGVQGVKNLGGANRSLTTKRILLGRLVGIKGITRHSVAESIGIKTPILKNFMDAKNVNLHSAMLISTYLNDDNLKDVKGIVKRAELDKLPKTNVTKTEEINKRKFRGVGKGKVRDIFVNRLLENGENDGIFFSLPSNECQFEIQVNTEIDNTFKFEVVESEELVYNEMLKTIGSNNIHTKSINNCFSEELILKYGADRFSNIFMDWCLTFNAHENEVNHIIRNKLVEVGGLVGFTFCLRDKKTKMLHHSILHHPKLKRKVGSIDALTNDGIIISILTMCKDNYEVIEVESYRDGAPMLFVLIKRLK